MKKIMFAFLVFLFACGKTNLTPEVKALKYQVVHVASTEPGHFCLGSNPVYDTVSLVPPNGYYPPWVNSDSSNNGTYYLTYVVKEIK